MMIVSKHKTIFLSLVFLSTVFSLRAQTTYLRHVNLINTATGILYPDMAVILHDSVIMNIAPDNSKLKVPDSALVIDLRGKYLMPGLIDAHIHFFQSGGLYTRPDGLNLNKFYSYEKDQQWIKDNLDDQMRRYLACGITTVIDVGGPFSNFSVRDYCDANPLSPNAFVTGPLVSTYLPPNLDKKDPPIIKVTTEDQARELVRRQLPYKPDFIKIWYINMGHPEKDLPLVKAAIDESHKNNLKVAVHATEYETAMLAVGAGADILVHSIDDKPADKAFTDLLKSRDITYIPTLLVADGYARTFSQQFNFTAHDFRFANPFMLGTLFDLQHLPAIFTGVDFRQRRKNIRQNRIDSMMLSNLKMVSDAGINIASGTDAGNIGTEHASSFLDDLLAMRKGGMTNAQILKASTINTAKGFGKEKIIGAIGKGKLANILVLNRNPLDSLEYLDDIFMLINRGKKIKPDTLLPATPEILAQQQLNGYNAHDIEAFLAPYSDSAQIFIFPDKPVMKGKDQMRKGYTGMFQQMKDLHCQLVNRIVNGNTVIDQESVTGMGPGVTKAVLTYVTENGKISKVYIMR